MIPTITREEWRLGKRRLPLSEDQLKEERYGILTSTDNQGNTMLDSDTVFTCDDCTARYDCVYVFDPYNIGGDCLAEK